jgi:O-antigen/teichoic acid export membrane protein
MINILGSFYWVISGKISKNLITFLITVVLARLLSPSDFGLIAIVTGITALANILVDFGFNSSIVQMDDNDIDSNLLSSVFWFNLLFATCLGLFIYLISGFISNYYLNDQLNYLIKLSSLVFILNAFSSLHTALLKKRGSFKKISLSKLYASFASGIIAISFALIGLGVYSLIFGIILDSFFFTILIWSKKTFTPNFILSYRKLKSIFGFSFKIFISRFFEEIINQLDYLIIGKIVNFKVLGFFQRGKSLSALTTRYGSESILFIMFPILSKIKNDEEEFKKKCFETFSIVTFGCFVISTLIFNSTYEIIDIIYGQKWISIVPYFSLLLIYSIVFPINRVLTLFLKSVGKGSKYLSVFMFQKTDIIISIIVLILFKSIDLYLYSSILFGYIFVVLSIFYVTKILKFDTRSYLIEFFKILTSSVVIVVMVNMFKEVFTFENSAINLTQNVILTFILFILISFILRFKSRDYFLQILIKTKTLILKNKV